MFRTVDDLSAFGGSHETASRSRVYTTFDTTYNELGVKPVDDNQASQYKNSDHAGTPENFKAYVIGGATGGGGSNFTGSYSGTGSCALTRQSTNFEGIEYIDSGGLGTLVGLVASARNRGGEIKLVRPVQRVVELLRRTRLDAVFKSYDSDEEAIAAFGAVSRRASASTQIFKPR